MPPRAANCAPRRSPARKRARPVRIARPLVHVCAAIALAYAARCASFAASWLDAPLLARPPEEPLPLLSIVVPARDEERSIERCVRSLLAQLWVDVEVIVVDDRSSDATRAILERLAREDARLHVIRGAELPAGWIGKPWALAQGVRRARGAWFLFTDADSWHEPAGAASMLWLATRARVDAVSIATRQELGTFWERAALPSILGLILFVAGPLGAINDPKKPKHALANGQYILTARSAYEALGGHAALRAEIVEDVAFARRMKEDGRFRFLLVGGDRIASVRMYRSLAEIWAGFTKNVFVGANGDVRALGGGMAFMFAISVLPPALALNALSGRRYVDAIEASLATVTIVATASWGMRRAGFSRRLALLQPLGTALFIAIVANSSARVLSGRGVDWRGRTYHAASGEAPRANEPKPVE
ncbi:MAG: hydroxychlorobactene glucosyltransferase CruC [Vulcanimicrobiaceae bacterium]